MEMLVASAPVVSSTGDKKDRMWAFTMTLPVRQSVRAWICSFIRIFADDFVFLGHLRAS